MTTRRLVWPFVILSIAAALQACTATGPREGFAASDPLEPANRVFHEVNVRLDRFLLRPVAQGYDLVTPTVVKHMIGNGFDHLDSVSHLANHILQADVDGTMETLGRFTINTVFGAGGLLDPATEFGLSKQDTDFGITLGKNGVAEGPYLMLPVLGPSTLRDLGGFVVDQAFSPTTYIGSVADSDAVGPLLTGLDVVDNRDRNRDLIDDVLYESADSYVTIRSAYLQRRRARIAGDEIGDQLPDIFDEPEPER